MFFIDCNIDGGGATIWNGTSFRCQNTNHVIILRHSQINNSEIQKIRGVCTNGKIVASAIGIVNDSYISQLNVTVTPEMNNKTVECWHNHNLTDTLVKRMYIILITQNLSLNQSPINTRLSNVGRGELTFNWTREPVVCNASSSSFQYIIDSVGCGICPLTTLSNDNHVTCTNVSLEYTLCSFTVVANTTEGIILWETNQTKAVNITLQGKK